MKNNHISVCSLLMTVTLELGLTAVKVNTTNESSVFIHADATGENTAP